MRIVKWNKLSKRVVALIFTFALLVSGISVIVGAVDVRTNIALNATAYSEEVTFTNKMGSETVNDGNAGTATTSAYGGSAYARKEIYLDFDATYTVNEITLLPRMSDDGSTYKGGIPEDFTISAYTAAGWVEVAKKVGLTDGSAGVTLEFDEVDAAAVRLTATKLSKVDGGSQYALQVAEFEVYGVSASTTVTAPQVIEDATNIARTATVESEEVAWTSKMGSQTVVDGNKDSATTCEYISSPFARRDIYLTLDRTYTIDQIVLYPRTANTGTEAKGGFPEDFTMSAYTAEGWVNVAVRKGEIIGTEAMVLCFEPIDAVAIRLTATKLTHVDGGSKYALQMAEIEVYGVNASTTVTAPQVLEGATNVALFGTAKSEVPSWAAAAMHSAIVNNNNKLDATTCEYITTSDATREIYITFDKTYRIDQVVLYPRVDDKTGATYKGGFPEDFVLKAYTANGWVEIVNKTGIVAGTNGMVFNFGAVDARAVCLTATKLSHVDGGPKFALQMAEFEVYGIEASTNISAPNILVGSSNIALKATAESEEVTWTTKMGSEKVNDGNKLSATTCEYVSDANTTREILLKFDKNYEVNKVVLYPRTDDKQGTEYKGGFPEDFTISVYTANGWKEVVNKVGVKDGSKGMTLEFANVKASAICLTATKLSLADGGPKYALQMAEFEVYGVSADTSIALPTTTPGATGSGSGGNGGSEGSGGTEPEEASNIALKATAESEEVAWTTKMGSEKVNDGNKLSATTCEYVSDANTTREILLKFDKNYKVNKVVLYPRTDDKQGTEYRGGFPEDFTISVYTANGWKEVANKVGVKDGSKGMTLEFANVEASAICLTATKLSLADGGPKYALQMAEFEVYGVSANTSIALPTTTPGATGSGSGGDGGGASSGSTPIVEGNIAPLGTAQAFTPQWAAANFNANRLNDNNISGDNFWTTEYYNSAGVATEAYITLDTTYKVSKFVLYPRTKKADGSYVGGFPQNFKISVWTGSEWKEVATEKRVEGSNKPYTVTIPAIDCRAVKLSVSKMSTTDGGAKYALQLAEMAVVGTDSAKNISAPKITVSAPDASNSNTLVDEDNICLYCPVSGSSSWDRLKCLKGNVNDGNTGNMWASNGDETYEGKEEYIEINLLDNYMVDTVIMYARNYRYGWPVDFTISVYYDGKWTDVVKKSNYEIPVVGSVTAHEFTFAPTIGNKIRITSDNYLAAGNETIFCLCEVVAYGKKATGNHPLPNDCIMPSNISYKSSSTVEDYGYYLNQLFDGDYDTEWSSAAYFTEKAKEVVEVDLNRTMTVGEIQLKPAWKGSGFPKDFSISVYANGKWVDVYSAKDYKTPEDEAIQRFKFEPREISKFKITATKLDAEGGVYVMKLSEIMLYRTATGADFDLGAVDEIASEKLYASAEVNDSASDEKGEKDEKGENIFTNQFSGGQSMLPLILGIIAMVVGVAGCVVLLIYFNKKKKISQE